jgi:hypothetical protein
MKHGSRGCKKEDNGRREARKEDEKRTKKRQEKNGVRQKTAVILFF